MADRKKKNQHPNARGGVKPENLSSSAVRGRSYKSPSGSGRAESAGYTTSSPGWRRDAAPAAPKRAAGGGGGRGGGGGKSGGGGHKRRGGGDRGPRTTGAGPEHGIQGPQRPIVEDRLTRTHPEDALPGLGATTSPSALFQPLPSATAANATTSPSSLIQPFVPTPSFHGQPPAPQGVVGQPQGPLPPEIQPAPPLDPSSLATPSSVRPPPVIHPPNPTMGVGHMPGGTPLSPDQVIPALLARQRRGALSGPSPLDSKPVIPWFGS